MFPGCLEPSLQSDLVLVSRDGVRSPCHAALLAVSSPLLANILGEVEDQEIILDWDSSLVTSLLQYLYTGEVRLDQEEDKEDLQEMMGHLGIVSQHSLPELKEEVEVEDEYQETKREEKNQASKEPKLLHFVNEEEIPKRIQCPACFKTFIWPLEHIRKKKNLNCKNSVSESFINDLQIFENERRKARMKRRSLKNLNTKVPVGCPATIMEYLGIVSHHSLPEMKLEVENECPEDEREEALTGNPPSESDLRCWVSLENVKIEPEDIEGGPG